MANLERLKASRARRKAGGLTGRAKLAKKIGAERLSNITKARKSKASARKKTLLAERGKAPKPMATVSRRVAPEAKKKVAPLSMIAAESSKPKSRASFAQQSAASVTPFQRAAAQKRQGFRGGRKSLLGTFMKRMKKNSRKRRNFISSK